MEDNLVSIITPSYNSSRFIKDTIESVINQTYQNWELLITDDCSIDNTVAIIEDYVKKDSRIKIFIQDKNRGPGAARNNSISRAKGRYIAFLDSDDIWEKNKLERQIDFITEKNVAFVFSSYYLMNESGVSLKKIIRVPEQITYRGYLKNTIIGCLTVLIDIKQTGKFEMPLISTSQDMATWLQILKKGYNAYGMLEVLAGYRLVQNSNTAKKWKAVKDVWKVYRDIEHLPFIFSCYNWGGYLFNAIFKRI